MVRVRVSVRLGFRVRVRVTVGLGFRGRVRDRVSYYLSPYLVVIPNQ